jgi:hypothetical protein
VSPPTEVTDRQLLDIPTPDLDLYARRARAVGGLPPVVTRIAGRALDGPLLDGGSIDDLGAMERLPVTVLEASPAALALRLEAPAAGWLVVTDRYSPGWRRRGRAGDPRGALRVPAGGIS